MKKMLALAIATALASPMALADNTPDNVGDVTYLGNIVANSPMWQWTVNDYPGGRLDAKPSTAVTANGVTTYPLNGQAFIAASGYLPSFVGINIASGASSTIGTRDITTLTDQDGSAPLNITDAQKGAVTFTIAASANDANGAPVAGTLKLKATEVRGGRYAWSSVSTGEVVKGAKRVYVLANTNSSFPVPGGSCWAGTGSFDTTGGIVGGTAEAPAPGTQSVVAFNAFVDALDAADMTGSAPRFGTLTAYPESATQYGYASCAASTMYINTVQPDNWYTYDYFAAAHVMELTPVELSFSKPVSGAWNSTLTVTAYQM